jgi:hypothetical protein
MQVQIFIGDSGDGKPLKLQEVQDRLNAIGQSAPIVQAGAYGEDSLVEILEVRASGGQREILVDGCSRIQILRVLEWRSCIEDESGFNDLVVHLARQD